MQNAKEHLETLEKICQTKESLLQAKESESTHLLKLLELKEKKVTELQSSGKVAIEYTMLNKAVTLLHSFVYSEGLHDIV